MGGFLLAICVAMPGLTVRATEVPLRLVPAPQKVDRSPGAGPLDVSSKSVAIVIGEQATEPERYAADRLQQQVARRFGQQWPIVPEKDQAARARAVVLLGLRSHHAWLDALCSQRKIDLSESSPGFDGYVIEMFQADDRDIVLVGGSNPRGVTYGQDTLFQMLTGRDGRVLLARASIRDWPTAPWRGRPQTAVKHYLRPGELDLLASSRVNFIDLRNGTYAYEGGDPLEKDLIVEVIREAHRRGMIVYGAVNCGIPVAGQEAVMGTFREMIGLGVDGLWLSFDDKGPGEAPAGMTHQVLDLGRRHGMTGRRIAITPPKGSYQDVVTPFNREIMAVPGMEQALWFWTCLPNRVNAEAARSIGLKCRPAWWHNWPRIWTSPVYQPPPPLEQGWHGADDEILRTLTDTCEAVMPWGGNQLPQYYVAPAVGWWGWNPAGHDFADVRARIAHCVFGPDLADEVRAFDTGIERLQSMLRYPMGDSTWCPAYPPRLCEPPDRDAAIRQLGELETRLAHIEKHAPARTLLDPGQLASEYLQRMRQELDYDRALVSLPFPETWWPDHQRRVLNALYDGHLGRVDELMPAARGRLNQEIEAIQSQSAVGPRFREYLAFWTRMAGLDAAGWQALLAKRQAEFKTRIAEYGFFNARLDEMLAPLRHPPLDWGTGHWDRTNRVRATVLPAGREQFWGGWLGGLYEHDGLQVAAFAAGRKESRNDGEFCELSADLPVSGRRDRLALLVYLANVNKDLVGGQFLPCRWANHCFVQLLWGDRILWESDVGPDRRTGEWFMAKLPPIPAETKTLPLRLRVVDRIWSVRNYTLVFVGPIRLIELAEP